MRDIADMKNKIIFLFAVTFFALCYVNQQALIYQMGLSIKENYQIYTRLVDQNRILEYNVLNLKSPVNLEDQLDSRKIEMTMPQKWQVIRVAAYPVNAADTYRFKKGLFANLFVAGREAEASPNINNVDKVSY